MRDADLAYQHCLKQIDNASGVPVRLDSERSLSTRFGISQRVARGILQRLVREGLAEVRHGRGYFACPSSTPTTHDDVTVGVVWGAIGTGGVIESRAQEDLLSALITRFRAMGMHVELLSMQDPQNLGSVKRMANEHPVDAYMLCSVPPEIQAFFARGGKPAVVWGSTYEDLELCNVELNSLEIAREATEQAFSSGHRCVCLLQEYGCKVGWERAHVGFEYAYNIWQIRFKPERIVRVDRKRYGIRPAAKQLSLLAPTALLVQNASLLEWLCERVDSRAQDRLAQTEITVLDPDLAGVLKHPAKVVHVDWESMFQTSVQLLADLVAGRSPLQRRHEIPWKLVRQS